MPKLSVGRARVGAAALLGVGVLLAGPPDAPEPGTAALAVRLATVNSVLAPGPR
jgi:hypothetical protein